MPYLRHYVGPSWPPHIGAYDYALALCPSDLAWEFLRRNADYQRDYRLGRRGIQRTRRLRTGLHLTRVRRHTLRSITWGLIPFVDPALPAPQAPVCWLTSDAAPILDAVCERAKDNSQADLAIAQYRSAGHVIIGPTGLEHVILKDADRALTLRLQGSRATLAPVSATFLVSGIPQPHRVAADFDILAGLVHSPRHKVYRLRERLFLRDALVALDGRHTGASYRETAAVIYGPERARAAWSSASTAMKERMRHALARGQQFRNGAYKKLLE